MKKVLGIVVIVVVLAAAGGAFADDWGHGRRGGHGYGWNGQGGRGAAPMQDGRGMYGHGHMGMGGGHCYAYGANNAEMPQEIKDKLTEAEKTAVDLRAEMGKSTIDRAKVTELHTKYSSLRQAVSDWCFQQRLDAVNK